MNQDATPAVDGNRWSALEDRWLSLMGELES
jgi:hypothetical protein